MAKFKIGDKVRIVSDTYADGSPYKGSESQTVIGKVVTIEGYDGKYYKVQIEGISYTYDLSERDLVFAEKTLDNLEVGDIIADLNGDEREVVAVGPAYIATIDKYDGSDDLDSHEIEKLKGYKWTVKQDIEQKEVTLEEIAKKFNVPVAQLRIKE